MAASEREITVVFKFRPLNETGAKIPMRNEISQKMKSQGQRIAKDWIGNELSQ